MSAISEPNRRLALAGLALSLVPLSAPHAEEPLPKAATPASAQPRVVLRAAPVKRKLVADAAQEAETWAFDGAAPNPVLRVPHGGELSVRLQNDTPAPLSLHWHGVRAPNPMDGVAGLTQSPVAPGASFDYRFTPPDAGVYLVRPIVPGSSSEPAGRGLSALLVVDEREPPPVEADFAILVRDWRVEPSGALAPFGDPMEAAVAGRLGNRLSVEGSDAPKRIEARPGSRIRLRLANASNARILRLRFDDMKVFVAAVDGQPTDKFEPLRASLPFPPGTRYDILAELGTEAGLKSRIVALVGDGIPLVEIEAAGAAAGPKPGEAARPLNLPSNRLLPPEIRLQNALRRDIPITGGATRSPSGDPVFTGNPRAIWTLGRGPGAATSPPLFTAKRGQPIVLSFHNQTSFPQPLHLHGHVFRLLHGLDDGWEPYWLDTFQAPEGRTSRIAFVADNPGKWLIGSTVLERLDTGLWGWFEVT